MSFLPKHFSSFAYRALFFLFITASAVVQAAEPPTWTVNDVTQLNPIQVKAIVAPTTTEEIIQIVQSHAGPISIGGGRYSMGGQTATENAVQIDMRRFDKVLSFSKDNKEITVQAGITWRKVQEYIDPHNLSVLIKQTYSNFTVGGSLSVNVHGRYIGLGPLILSVKSIKLILPDGRLVEASPTTNKDLFYGAIGGYGALGVITEATLQLTDNVKVERKTELMSVSAYKQYFMTKIRDDANIVFHNADIHPSSYTTLRAISYTKTDKPLTVEDRLVPLDRSYWWERFAYWAMSEWPWKDWIREHLLEPLFFAGECVEWRNYEASYDVKELEPSSRESSTYVLQEYFVPVEQFDLFVPKMGEIFRRHDANIINVSIRHAKKDPGSLLAWARNEVFAFVVYYKQSTNEPEKQAVAVWTRELIDAAIALGGAYYLPYQIHATSQQFKDAYPRWAEFFALKKTLDPTNKFRNKLWDAYYTTTAQADTSEGTHRSTSRIKKVMADKRMSDGIFLFLQNVYGLYPADKFHYLIHETAKQCVTDQEIYETIQKRLPEITPSLWSLRYALPALRTQKAELARETAELLQSTKPINGYLEIGTTGRYVNALQEHLSFQSPIYLSYYEAPTYGAQDIVERGQLFKIGRFFDLDHYNPIPRNEIADESVDLVTLYIGLHHCPYEKLDAYVQSLWRILRPGGKLIIRDHNVTSPAFGEFVSVVHDIFYCGLGESWEYTNTEIRNFSASEGLSLYLEKKGFKADPKALLQNNDPSKNTLKMFTKGPTNDIVQQISFELAKMPNYKRDEAQTYLTLPEWFLVYSPAEYAQFIQNKPPSDFPYFPSIGQFWSYYRQVYNLTKEKYAVNWGYHVMVFVIGTSYTVENAIKGIYEATIGRLTEWFRGQEMTKEDKLAAQVAQEYVDFIRVDPWYEFPFYDRFKKVWNETGYTGPSLLRKYERKCFLSSEYGGKALYAWLIRLATKSVYGDADTEMLTWMSNVPLKDLQQDSTLRVVQQFSDASVLVALPRYERFRDVVLKWAAKGAVFREIAGNDVLLMTAVVPTDWHYNPIEGKILFSKPILTNPHQKRVAIQVPVKHLHTIVNELIREGTPIEHLYDY